MDDYGEDSKIDQVETSKEFRAAILRFINETRKQLTDMATVNMNKVVTGEMEVGPAVRVVLNKNQTRKIAYIENNGMIECKIYGVDKDSIGGYVLWPKQSLPIGGFSAVGASTTSGVTTLCYIDS